jgi:ADP-dependent phosphofructokinase/glucokinase
VTGTVNWHDRYFDLGKALVTDAPSAGPFLFGFNICVDAIWSVNPDQLQRMAAIASEGRESDPATRACRAVVDRIASGRGGELFLQWTEGPAWFDDLLDEPNRLQVGGTGPQAAWTLAELGAQCVIPLVHRSPEQLAVLPSSIEVAVDGGLVPVRELTPSSMIHGEPGRPRHYILQFKAGTPLGARLLPRSTRIILRFADDGIECDDALVALHEELLPKLHSAVVSGMNAIHPADTHSWSYLSRAVDAWTSSGVAHVHLELAEYPKPADLRAAAGFFAGRAHSLGLSLSELHSVGAPHSSSPAEAARALGERHRYPTVVIHADDWALAVHRQDPAAMERRLMSGNLLASVRAAHDVPQAHLDLPTGASFAEDIPESGALGDGWWVTCVPSPWMPTPTSTIGLGDSFVAGFQLGAYCGDPAKVAAI